MNALHFMRPVSLPLKHAGLALLSGALICIAVPARAQFKAPPGTSAAASKAAASSKSANPKAPQLVDSILAVVNNEVITRRELIERAAMVERRLAEQNKGAPMPPRGELQRRVLEDMIVERAELQLAADTGIKIDDAGLDRAVLGIAEQNKLSLADFKTQLEREGTPFAQFRDEIRREMILQRLRQREVDNKIQISDTEIDNYLATQAGAAAVAGPQQEVDLAQILVRVPEGAGAAQVAAGRERAEDAYRQIKSGGDFAKVAATFSDSPEAAKGGDLGWRTKDQFPQLFVDAIASLKPGDVAPVLRSPNGFHILKLVGQRTASAAQIAVPSVVQTHARHILIKVNQLVTEADAKRKLIELKERLTNHAATFEELAKLYSNDLSASKGGDLGWIYPGDTVPQFEQAMNALKPGQISDPVQTPFGFHLIEVLERKTDDVSRERLRAAARQAIQQRKQQEATAEWLRVLRDRAYVEYRFDDNAG